MALNSFDEIMEARRFLQGKYHQRNTAYGTLRKLYNSDYWTGKPQVQGAKLIYNLIASIVDKYTDFMSQTPDWRVIPADVTEEATKMADKQEKLLYAQWELNNNLVIQQWQAHLQSLLGFFGFEVLPNVTNSGEMKSKEKYVNINVLNPDYILPMPRTDNIRDLDFVIIEAFDYTLAKQKFMPSLRPDQRKEMQNTFKYYDEEKIIIIKEGKVVNRIQHDFGFIPVILGQNRVKPHFVEGIGDLDQATGLNEYLNELLSWQADILEYAANPITLIKGWANDQKLPVGPGAQWFGGPEFEAKFLTSPGQPPEVENMFARVTRAIQDMTGLGEPIFASDIPSGTSGSAVKTLLSGIQATMLRKQISLGDVYSHVNEIIFKIIERMFAKQKIIVRGTKKGNIFVEKMKGEDINENYRNQAIWPPGALDQPSRATFEITKLNAGIQSKFTTMENIGILSPLDEKQRIREEQNEELQRRLVENQGGQSPFNRDFATAQNQLAKLEGPGGQQPQGQPQSNDNELQVLVDLVQGLDKIKGSVFLEGREEDKFNLVLTDMKDKSTIVNRLPEELKGRINFRKFVEDQDETLRAIVDKEEEPANA